VSNIIRIPSNCGPGFYFMDSPVGKAPLRVQTEPAVALGRFRAPTCLVNDEWFWGHDGPEAGLAWATRPQASAQ
jgi:hypothetical protein